MSKTKVTKRALIISALSLVICISMLLGTTYAWFTDSVVSAGNIIKSGTLDVEMYYADGTKAVPTTYTGEGAWTDASTGAIFNYDLWEPGYTQVRHIQIKNVGTLALKYKVQIVANGTVSDLADVIDVYYMDPAQQIADRAALAAKTPMGTLTAALAGMDATASGNLRAGEADTVTIALKMQESAGNEYQNKSIGTDFSIQLLATQYTYEKDSFDDQYDAAADGTPDHAVWPVVSTTVVADKDTVISNGITTITIPANAATAGDTVTLGVDTIQEATSPDLANVYVVGADGITSLAYEITLANQDGTKVTTSDTDKMTVKLYVGEAGASSVTHVLAGGSTEDMTFTYDPATGYVTFETTSFSPYLVKTQYSAKIGDTRYETLADAVAAVESGVPTTIKMIANEGVYGNAGILIASGKDVTVDLNGKTICNLVNANKASQVFDNIGTLTIKDSVGTGIVFNNVAAGTAAGDWWSTPQYNYVTNVITNKGKLTLDGGTLKSTSAGSINYCVDNQSGTYAPEFVMNGGELYNAATNAVRLFCNSTTKMNSVVINGGTVSGYYPIWMQCPNTNRNKGSITINGGTINDLTKKVVSGEISLFDGSYIETYAKNTTWSDDSRFIITGGTFNVNILLENTTYESGNSYSHPHTEITGGVFNGGVYSSGTEAESIVSGGTFAFHDYENGTTSLSDLQLLVKKGYATSEVVDGYFTVSAQN